MGILLKSLLLLVVSYFVIGDYYAVSAHQEKTTGYVSYLVMVFIVYLVYKITTILKGNKKVSFNPLSIAGFSLLHIFILSLVFFESKSAGAFTLFFKIIGFSILPFFIAMISYSFGKKVLSYIDSFKEEENNFKIITSLGLGFSLFTVVLCILGFVGFYNIYSLFTILIGFSIFSYRELLESFKSLYTFKFEFDNHDTSGNTFAIMNTYLLSTEFLFWFITFLVGVNLINIVRPMPIGWDDLGVYMNYPKIMGTSGTIMQGIGMSTWHVFTGIGFMFKSATQAFFLNNLGGILAIISLGLIISSFFKTQKKKLLNLPLIGIAIFYSMPMVIFQQAKDMKLDPGLFFVTIVSIYVAIYTLWNIQKEEKLNKKTITYLAIAGLLVGVAFTIKATTLMLILGLIGVLFYRFLGTIGFFAFFSFFVGIFTKLKLWGMMNVVYPDSNVGLLNTIFLSTTLIGIILLAISFIRYKAEYFNKLLLTVVIFIFSVGIGVSPWAIKNINETKSVSISSIISGKSVQTNNIILDKIYTKEELKNIENSDQYKQVTSSGKSMNEDLGRYLGYEDGINNYLKLPYNLTMQKNQGGEFTDITFLYLLFIPVLFIFLPYKKEYLSIGILACVVFEYLYFKDASFSKTLTAFFSDKNLPNGYLYIFAVFTIPFLYLLNGLKKDNKNADLFKLFLVLGFTYCFLFVIAAFGIVWYGIAMYFIFIIFILSSLFEFSTSETMDDENKIDVFKFIASVIFFILLSIHIFASSFLHGYNNLKTAGFDYYKNGLLNQNQSIFLSHPDYLKVLANLNLKDTKIIDDIINNSKNPNLKKIIENYAKQDKLTVLPSLMQQIISSDLSKSGLSDSDIVQLRLDTKELADNIYNKVLFPSKEEKNPKVMYRAGTFMTYFIVDNYTRYYEDSLLFGFNKYFYNKDSNITIDKLKKAGLGYILLDLNAATIDKDPRHDLTKRFENMLATMSSSSLDLIYTDNMCLKVAIDEYKRGNFGNNVDEAKKKFIKLAGVNYESYDEKGNATSRIQKQLDCLNYIVKLGQDKKIDSNNYSYLSSVIEKVNSKSLENQKELISYLETLRGWYALFEIK